MRFFNRKFYAQLYSTFSRLNEMRNSQSLSKSLPLVDGEGTRAGCDAGEVHYWRQSVRPLHGFWFFNFFQQGELSSEFTVVTGREVGIRNAALVSIGVSVLVRQMGNVGPTHEFHLPAWKDR